jgi:hypothetical protein
LVGIKYHFKLELVALLNKILYGAAYKIRKSTATTLFATIFTVSFAFSVGANVHFELEHTVERLLEDEVFCCLELAYQLLSGFQLLLLFLFGEFGWFCFGWFHFIRLLLCLGFKAEK